MYVVGSNRNAFIEWKWHKKKKFMTPKEVGVRELFSKRALSELNFQESLEIDHPDKRRSNCTICVHTDAEGSSSTDRQGPRG